ncbi:oxygen-independent coproporphyrinogen III oxidase [Stanieria sp. NIES-3757]|nr:oxygen-independent coproporphyrinogen III oxidase [Stanieria sp. NIES-3757]
MQQNLSLNLDNYLFKQEQNSLRDSLPTAVYIHIPFCRRRCYYCDFPISVVGNGSLVSTSTMVLDYVEALCQEIITIEQAHQPLMTIFFGGGTPSLLPVPLLARILATLEQHFGIAKDAEISMEIDPGTFEREQLEGFLAAGVNRISLGVQAFQDELLQICGRSHKSQDILKAIALINQLNITNFSLDLISGLPKQTLTQWHDSLTKAIALNPAHLSCYDLVLETVTAFGKQYQPGLKPLPSDEDTANMYRLAQHMLTDAGYEHYEVSNYAKPGFQCRHNRVYWQNQPYYGFGMGAASFFAQKRFTRPRTRREYYAWVEAGAIIDVPELSATDYLLETLMLGLRLAKGIRLSNITQQFGKQVLKSIGICLQPYANRGWVETVTDEGIPINADWHNFEEHLELNLRLNDPEGFLFSNTILADLFEKFS